MGTIYNNIPGNAPTDNVYLNSLIIGSSWTPSVGSGANLTWSTSSGKIYLDVNANGSSWLLHETNALKVALQTWSSVANVQFNQVSGIYYSDFRYFNVNAAEMLKLSGDSTTLGLHDVPDGSIQTPLYGIFNKQGIGWNLPGLKQGGFGFLTLIHEIGHGLGLAHPHDGNTVFPGVTSAFGSLGDNNLNQGIWTVMSYNDGWVEVPTPTPALSYGQAGTPMAFDIAAIQYIYGANTTYKTGNDTYLLPTSNTSGTYWSCIWDAGGIDTISAATSRVSAEINLNTATLIGPNAAGFVSHVGKSIDGTAIVGGFTIANNVVIENATGGSADDILIGNQVNNILVGNAGNDTLYGNGGNDILNGGLGTDTLIGGLGDDTYFVDNIGDTVDESSGTGIDLVKVAIAVKNGTYTLSSSVENATLINKIAYNLTGNAEDNFLTGNAAANILNGGDGMDVLFGGTGADIMIGGDGIDTYVVDNIADVVIEQADEGSHDMINSFISFDLSTKGANVEYLQLVGKATNGKGNDLNNGIFGNSLANIISGGAGDDEISGGLGNDSLDGGTGADTMLGGKGNDTYIVDNSGDIVTELFNEGIDLVRASVNYMLSDNVENLTLTDGSVNGGAANTNGTGNALNNIITGNVGDNELDGAAGVDRLVGGLGDDTYIVDLIETGTTAALKRVALQDNVVEGVNAGTDTLQLHGNFNHLNATSLFLATSLENLDASATGANKLNLTGNMLNNIITGNDADNILDGGVGRDRLIGGAGNDTYVLDLKVNGTRVTANINTFDDIIDENNGFAEDMDSIKLRGSANLTNASTLALTGNWANIENLDASNTGRTKLNLTGNDEDNILIGNATANILIGGLGNDTLNGGAGADTLIGGYGNDIYIIDHIGDVISGESAILTTPLILQDSYGSTTPSISANGRYVIFDSYGEFNFGSPPFAVDVFIKDLQTGALIKVSDYSEAFVEDISADGRYVMYTTSADMPGDTNNERDTYLKDLQTGTTTIISTNSAQLVGNFGSLFGTAFLSDNAQFAAFSNYANNLVANDTNGKFDAFVKNLSTGDITLASTSSTGIQANNDSIVTSISANGRYVSFHSFATNLSNSDNNNSIDVYLKDTQTGTTTLVSTNVNGEVSNNISWYGSVSNDGNLVVFESDATNLVSSDTNSITDIFVKNIQTGDIIRISTSENGTEANDKSENAKFSSDGRYVVFESRANNLVAEDTNSTYDIFLKDLLTGAIQRVSTTSSGEQTNSDSNNAKMSDDGQFIVFQSIASNLITDDTNNTVDVFVKDLITGEVKRASEQILTNSLHNTDTVKASISYILGANLENLELTGSAAFNGTGNTLDNIITGNAAANILDGKEGADTMLGGKGNDTYIVDNARDIVTELIKEGIDLVRASIDYMLTDNVDNLTLTNNIEANGGTANINGTGNALNNIITGNVGDNELDGATGVDRLVGGVGNDTYIVDLIETGTRVALKRVALQDIVIEGVNAGTDTLELRGNFNHVNATTITLGANLENLDASATETSKLNLTGNALNNIITGNDADNILDGGVGRDRLIGGAGNDTLDGGVGEDTLVGGTGNDTYIVDIIPSTTGTPPAQIVVTGARLQDGVLELAGLTGGTDTLKLRGSVIIPATTAATNITLADELTGIENLDISATGTTRLSLTGNDDNNILTGNAANNIINGGAGVDTMSGGLGDDTYYMDNELDSVVETASAGVDTLNYVYQGAPVAYFLGANIENLTLGAGVQGSFGGNTLNNYMIGNSASILSGREGNDTLVGASQMLGGAGNDLYIINGTGQTANEYSSLEGFDRVEATVDVDLLGQYIENLTLFGSAIIGNGNDIANTITGNSNNNVLDGFSGNDTIFGGLGDDTLIGSLGNDILNGGAGQDFYVFNTDLDATNNKDTIQGFNVLEDQILLDYTKFNAIGSYLEESEFRSGAGVTTASTANQHIIFNTSTGALYYDADGVGGTTAIQFAILTNTLGALNNFSFLLGIDFSQTGTDQADNLNGTSGDDAINGLAGNDIINGGPGADIMYGDLGDDTFYVDNVDDIVFEDYFYFNESNGLFYENGYYNLGFFGGHPNNINTIFSSVTYTTDFGIGNLTLTGLDNINGYGSNQKINIITGNDASNILDGGIITNPELMTAEYVSPTSPYLFFQSYGGYDTLIGGKGDDTYIVRGGETIIENANEGIDTYILSYNTGIPTAFLIDPASEIENFILANDNVLHDNISGTNKDNLIVANNIANNIYGLAGNDELKGMGGDDKLFGMSGNDILWGGTGSDTFVFESAGTVTYDIVKDFVSGQDKIRVSDGIFFKPVLLSGIYIDVFFTGTAAQDGNDYFIYNKFTGDLYFDEDGFGAISQQLIANFLPNTLLLQSDFVGALNTTQPITIVLTDQVITGSAFNDALAGGAGNDTINAGTGNDTLNGGDGNDKLNGEADNDTLYGMGGGDTLTGGSGNDILDGGLGNDSMRGETGDDTYVVDSLNDFVLENLNEGNDIVKVAYNNQSTTAILLSANNNIENITVTGNGLFNITGDFGSNILIGNESSNVINGEAYEIIVLRGNNDQLYGGGGNDILYDPFGDNYFDGGTGADSMYGGSGHDTYIIDNIDDVVQDTGSDLKNAIYSSVSLIDSLIYNADVFLTGTDNINVSGYSNYNPQGFIKITGNSGNNVFGGAQNSYGAIVYHDELIGGKGNDTYYIDQGDVITELSGEGIDTVVLTFGLFGYILGSNLENLITIYEGNGNSLDNVITGSNFNDVLKGMAGSDSLIGGNGDDTLTGGTGNDSLTGGLGGDVFKWSLADKVTNGLPAIDRITDFSSTDDRLDLRDLLEGESGANILNFLDVTASSTAGVTSTEIRISNTGGFAGGIFATDAVNQHITLAGVNLLTGTNEIDLLATLIAQNKLIIDV